MMMAPSTYVLLKYCTMERCSSEVPGGVSTTRKSTSPQSTSRKNCLIKPDNRHTSGGQMDLRHVFTVFTMQKSIFCSPPPTQSSIWF